jgi:hypothetical protein
MGNDESVMDDPKPSTRDATHQDDNDVGDGGDESMTAVNENGASQEHGQDDEKTNGKRIKMQMDYCYLIKDFS